MKCRAGSRGVLPRLRIGAAETTSKGSNRRAGLSTPVRGIGRPAEGRRSGGAFEALFDARAGDDRRAVAEAHPGPEGSMVVPEVVELRVEPADLLLDLGVVLGGEAMPELGPLLTQALDLRVDFARGS